MRRILRKLAIGLACLLAGLVTALVPAYLYYHFRDTAKASGYTWGVTFSPAMSRSLGLDWQANFTAILDDLKPNGLRLIAAWDSVEPTPDTWDFTDLDWEMDQAERRGTKVILTIGQKVPRWPECHIPEWADADAKKREAQLLAYEREVVGRYRDSPSLQYWQVENEPYINYGACGDLDRPVIPNEVTQVRALDPAHPIMMTDGGEWGPWVPSMSQADVFGSTLYRHVYDNALNMRQTNWLPPEYYAAKADLTRLIAGKPRLPVIISELGEEPWGNKQIQDMTLAEQEAFISPQQFSETLRYALKTGFDTYYLWGAEWWYYAKEHGQPAYWDLAKQTFATDQAPSP